MHVALRRAGAPALAIALLWLLLPGAVAASDPVVPWTPGSVWTPDSDLHSASGLSVWAIDAYVESVTGVPNLGAAFMAVERQEGINARAFVAAAMHETGGGWSYLARVKNNLFGWMAFDRNPIGSAMSFPSWDASVRYVGRQVRALYLDPEGRWASMPTLRAVGRTYASDPGWASGVSGWVNRAVYPSLRDGRLHWGAPTLSGPAAAGQEVEVRLPVSVPAGFPGLAGLRLEVTWSRTLDPLADPAAPLPVSADHGTAATAPNAVPGRSSATPGPQPPAPAALPASSGVPGASAVPAMPAAEPPIVISETSGPAAYRHGALVATVPAPSIPGTYAVRVGLRDVDGSQLPGGQRVTAPAGMATVYGPYMAKITSPAMPRAVAPGAQVLLDLTVMNTGTSPWAGALPGTTDPLAALSSAAAQPTSLRVVWRQGTVDPGPQVAALVPVPLPAGGSQTISLMLVAPAGAGRYTLTADVVDPVAGSLAATGYPTYHWKVTVAQPGPARPTATTRP